MEKFGKWKFANQVSNWSNAGKAVWMWTSAKRAITGWT